MKIVVLDGHALNPGDLSWDGLAALGKLKVYDRTAPEEIVNRAAGAAAVLTNKTLLNRETIRKLTDLTYIGLLSSGSNVVNVEAATKRGVVVTNAPGYATDSVAEHVFALLLDLARRTDLHALTVRKGRWSREPDFCYWLMPLTELSGLTMGLVGFGAIGRAVAVRAAAFGMRLLVHTRTPPAAGFPGVEFAALDQVLRQSDVVSLHCPLTTETENLMNAARLALLKPTAWLINTSRGGLIDEEALLNALREKKLAAAALDVLQDEPPSLKNPLLAEPNCRITPHQAWATLAARRRLMEAVTGNLAAFLAGQPRNVVTHLTAAGGAT